MVNVADGSQLWGERYSRRMSDIFETQEAIARAIAERLRLRLTGKEVDRLSKRHTESTRAYRLYLRGRYHWNKRNPEAIRRALDFFQQAIEEDPAYALAYTGIADCHHIAGGAYLDLPPKEALRRARSAAVKALEIDDSLAEAHATMSGIRSGEWKWREAEEEVRRAIELNPGYATAHQWYGELLASLGRFDEGIDRLKRALEIDPLSLIVNTSLGRVYMLAGEYDLAMEQLSRALELDPGFPIAHGAMMESLLWSGRRDEAARYLTEKMLPALGTAPEAIEEAKQVYEEDGWNGLWRLRLRNLAAEAGSGYVSNVEFAAAHATLGEVDEAFAALERACEQHDYRLDLLYVLPWAEPLRPDPRFEDLLRRMNFPEEILARGRGKAP